MKMEMLGAVILLSLGTGAWAARSERITMSLLDQTRSLGFETSPDQIATVAVPPTAPGPDARDDRAAQEAVAILKNRVIELVSNGETWMNGTPSRLSEREIADISGQVVPGTAVRSAGGVQRDDSRPHVLVEPLAAAVVRVG